MCLWRLRLTLIFSDRQPITWCMSASSSVLWWAFAGGWEEHTILLSYPPPPLISNTNSTVAIDIYLNSGSLMFCTLQWERTVYGQDRVLLRWNICILVLNYECGLKKQTVKSLNLKGQTFLYLEITYWLVNKSGKDWRGAVERGTNVNVFHYLCSCFHLDIVTNEMLVLWFADISVDWMFLSGFWLHTVRPEWSWWVERSLNSCLLVKTLQICSQGMWQSIIATIKGFVGSSKKMCYI